MRACKFLLVVCVAALAACGGPLPYKPEVSSRYQNLIAESELISGPGALTGTRTKKLAIVFSSNVKDMADYNEKLKKNFSSSLYTWTSTSSELTNDIDIVFSNERLLSVLLAGVKARFASVSFENDISTGFESGADYVGIVDIQLGADQPDFAATFDGIIRLNHTANASLIIIDPSLKAGPDIVANIAHLQNTPGKGPDGNLREMLLNIKIARSKMIAEFAGQVDRKIKP